MFCLMEDDFKYLRYSQNNIAKKIPELKDIVCEYKNDYSTVINHK